MKRESLRVLLLVMVATGEGTATVAGDRITFSPTKGSNVETNCAGTKTSKAVSLDASTFGYRVLPGAPARLELIAQDGKRELTRK